MENTPPPVPPQSDQSLEPVPPPLPAPTPQDQSWAIALHLSGFVGFVVPSLGQIIAPLVIWLIKRPESAYLDRVGKDVLNFQISYTIYAAVAAFLWWFFCIGLLVLPVILVLWIVFMIMAAVKTSNGEPFSYPLTIRFLQ